MQAPSEPRHAHAAAPPPRPATLLAFASLLCLAGCWSTTTTLNPNPLSTTDLPTPPLPTTPLPPIAWPPRDLDPVRELAQRTPSLVAIATPHPPDADWSPAFALELKGRPLTVVDHTIVGQGMIRRLNRQPDREGGLRWGVDTPRKARDVSDDATWRANAAFITSRTITASRNDSAAEWRSLIQEQLNRVLALHDAPARLSHEHDHFLIDAGLPIRLPSADSVPKRGLIIHFNSIQPNRFETELLNRLADQGWAVLHIATSAWIDSDSRPEDLQRAADARQQALQRLTRLIDNLPQPTPLTADQATPREVAARARLLRAADVMDRLSLDARLTHALNTPIRPAGFDLCASETPEDVGRRIASHVDQAIAGHVYAAEAALLAIDQTRPDLANLPVVLLGCSAGAFTVPATAARLGPRVAAAVLIGGGADIFAIARGSSLTSAGLILRCQTRPAPDSLIQRAHHAYLAHTQLDPIRLAPALSRTPTLHLHADLDTIVPASTGRLLSDRLGPHDRRTLLGGHTLLFLLLPSQAAPIAQWLERHVPAPRTHPHTQRALDNP